MRAGMIVASVLLAGCGLSMLGGKEHRVATQDAAGSVHVAVLSVAPWEQYRDALQPKFELTAEQALDRVLKIGRTSSYDQSSRTGLELTGGASEKSPEVEAPKTPAPATSREPVKIGSPENDPMMRYWAATALYQEVQLLNRYIRDAAIRKCYRAHVLRLQITLLPRARHEPYDAYSTIAFFAAGEEDDEEEVGSRDVGQVSGGPEVLPLLVTDNIEASLASRSKEAVLELAAAAGFGGGSTLGSVGASHAASALQKATGFDFNSLLTVARVSGNTIRVRLGAMQQGTTDFAMIPRTHNVTVLVMLPNPRTPRLELVARTTMVDAESGEQLRDRTPEEVDRLLLAAGQRYGLTDLTQLRTLLGHAQLNRTDKYAAAVPDAVETPKSLWLDLLGVRVGAQYASITVDLTAGGKESPTDTTAAAKDVELPVDQEVTVADDGTHMTLTLTGGKGLDAKRLDAWLVIAGAKTPGKVVIAGDVIKVTFPSRKGRGTEERESMYLQLAAGEAKSAKYRRLK